MWSCPISEPERILRGIWGVWPPLAFIYPECFSNRAAPAANTPHDTVRKHWRVLLPEVKLMWLLHKSRSAALFPVWSLLWNRNCSNKVKRLKLWRNSSTFGKIANVVWQTHNRTTVTHLQARQAQSVPPPWQPSAIFLHNLLLHPKKNMDPVKAETPGCSNIQCLLGLTDSVSLLSEK